MDPVSTGSRVVGLDTSLAATGVAWVEHGAGRTRLVASTGHKGATWAERRQRLALQLNETLAWVIAPVPDLVVIETPSYASKSTSAHDRSGLWWMAVAALLDADVPVAFAPPKCRMQYATGKGNAAKPYVVEEARVRLGGIWTAGFGGDDNLADAAVLCAMGHAWLGEHLAQLPKTHLAGLVGVAWPERAA